MDRILKVLFIGLMLQCQVWASESDLKIIQIGAWATGNTTFYIKFDRQIGPEQCRNSTVKINLGKDSDTQNVLMELNMIRSMALAAFISESKVRVFLEDFCLYGNPTISRLDLHK